MTDSYFLDTNIFFNYADPSRNWHTETRDLYNDCSNKHSGIRVKEEAKKVITRLNNYLISLTSHIGKGNDIRSFVEQTVSNANDKKFFLEMLKQNTHMSENDILGQFRARNILLDIGVKEAFSKLDHPLINKYRDLVLEMALRGNIDNISDVHILVDLVTWCMANSFLCLMTCDFTDFIHNRDDICGCICRVHLMEEEDLPLEIKHLGEI